MSRFFLQRVFSISTLIKFGGQGWRSDENTHLWSHRCSSDSNPEGDGKFRLRLRFFLALITRGFSPGTSGFPSLIPTIPIQINSNGRRRTKFFWFIHWINQLWFCCHELIHRMRNILALLLGLLSSEQTNKTLHLTRTFSSLRSLWTILCSWMYARASVISLVHWKTFLVASRLLDFPGINSWLLKMWSFKFPLHLSKTRTNLTVVCCRRSEVP